MTKKFDELPHQICTPAVTKCDTADVKGADVIATSTDSAGNLVVTFGCPGTSVEYKLTCRSGQWEGSRVDCSSKYPLHTVFGREPAKLTRGRFQETVRNCVSVLAPRIMARLAQQMLRVSVTCT